MSCVLRLPLTHVEDWPGTDQQLMEAIVTQLREAPQVQFNNLEGCFEFWVSENNPVLREAYNNGCAVSVTVRRDNQKYAYLLDDFGRRMAFKLPTPDLRVLLC